MKSDLAYKIMQRHNLIPGKSSRKVLNAIINGEEIARENLPDDVGYDQIINLREQYYKKITELKDEKPVPRYLPFYHIIKDTFPSFVWNSDNTLNDNRLFYIHAPRVKNLRPSLLSLLLNKVDEEKDTFLHRKYQCIDRLPNSIISILDQFMKQARIYYPPEKEMAEIVNILCCGLKGDKLTVFIPICPDYAIEYTGDPRCPVKFTFNDLGCGNGIIAQWILGAIKNLAETLESCNIRAECVVAMADFEAFSEGNLKTFGITKEEFLRRAHLSAQAFKNACPINANVIMFTDLCNEQKWLEQMEFIKKMFTRRDYGFSAIDRNILLNIVTKRKSLYSRWYGEKSSVDDYINIALDQGMMYAAMGAVLNERYKNYFVFASDNKVMRYFYSVAKRTPTLYLKKEYS
jgi:hypothetical protein